jgi:hypothetical protein
MMHMFFLLVDINRVTLETQIDFAASLQLAVVRFSTSCSR